MKDINKEKATEIYWLNRLSGDLPGISLPKVPLDEESSGSEPAGKTISLPVPGPTTDRLTTVSKGSDRGLFVLFLSGINLVLHNYTRLEDLVLGTISPRKEGVKKGKLLFCRTRVSPGLTFKELIQQVKENVKNDFNHGDYSFGVIYQRLLSEKEKKQGDSSQEKETGKLEIFNIAFTYDRIQDRSKLLDQFDIVLVLSHREEGLVLEIENLSRVYSREILLRFARNLIHVMDNLDENLDRRVSAIDIISSEEKEELEKVNHTGRPYPMDQTVQQLFQVQAARTPGNIALVGLSDKLPTPNPVVQHPYREGSFGVVHLSYGELNERANQLAHFLRAKGVKRGDIVGLMKERSVDIVIAMLGILKAGGAYLPIDSQAPTQRVVSMLEDCSSPFLLTEGKLLEKHPYTTLQGIETGGIQLHSTGPCERITDFDALPFPDRSLVDYEKYNRHLGQALVKNRVLIQAARGCPHRCAYCYRIWPRQQVARSAENIFKEIQLYYNLGMKNFDIFMLNLKQGKKLFQLIIENQLQDIRLFFPNGFRGDLLTRDYIDLMVEAGTVNFALALETASSRLQKLINKHLDLDKFRETVEYICKTYPQVILELFTLHGIPTETEEEAMMTLDFVKSLKWIHLPYVNVLKIYHNTGMEQLALEHGISRESILRSENMAWHEWSETLPFERSFTARYQADFLNNYVLSRERLLHVLPFQMKILSEDEFVRKYDSYLPGDIKSFADFMEFANLEKEDQLKLKSYGFRDEAEDLESLKGLNQGISRCFPAGESSKDALRVLLLDLSQFFSDSGDMLYDVVDPPLGLMYLLTYLNQQLGEKINGKIMKSRLDFDSYETLKKELEQFQPQVIGIRTLTYYKDFFHETVAAIREWGWEVPIITGGPYASVDYDTLLKDRHIDLAVLGEGEVTFYQLIRAIIAHKGKLPPGQVLKTIPGIAFVSRDEPRNRDFCRKIILKESLVETLNQQPVENAETINQPGDPAYIIFTSGSTGKPKGVIIEHCNAVNVLTWFGQNYQLHPGTHVIQMTNYTFDPSVEQIFSTLLHGAQVYIAPGELMTDKLACHDFVNRHQINVINMIPGVLKELFAGDEKPGSLQTVISGGERLEESLKDGLLEKGYCLYNHYGPTETTIDALMSICSGKPVTLGKPIANVQCYVLDKENYPVPIGLVGELYIGGAGVARGYLNNPELTAERFLSFFYRSYRSYMTYISKKLYKTGDLARWLPGGEVEFLGRRDHQVKIRGFRIELGEIQNQLLKHKGIKEAVVVVRDSQESGARDKFLCAYAVTAPGESVHSPDPVELKEFLALELPFYMVPAHIVLLERLPLTTSGKVDPPALPIPGPSTETRYEAPETETQELLVEIWSRVLGAEKEHIGIDTNFFEAGGDSIKVIQVTAHLHQQGLKLENADIFLYPTIKQISPFVESIDRVIHQGAVEGEVPLTPIQHWFFQENTIDVHHFNQAVMLVSPGGFAPEAVKAVFSKIQEHHDALRMTFKQEGETVTAINQGLDMSLALEVVDLRHLANKQQALQTLDKEVHRVQAGINLETGPLMKLGLFQLPDGDRLLIVVHHLVIDGISWRILFEDIHRLYQQYQGGESLELPKKTGSFKQWAERLLEYARGNELLAEKEYWKQVTSPQSSPPVIPRDFAGGEEDTNYIKDIQNLALPIGKEETGLLLTRVNHAFGTDINDILLASLALAVHHTWGHHRVFIAMEGHGREQILPDIDITQTVGWFTSQYPVILDISPGQDTGRLVKEVKETLRRVPHKGIGYGILKYLTPGQYKQEMNFQLKPQVGFNYLGQFDADLETTGFGMAAEPVGATHSQLAQQEHELEITSMITGHQLVLSISFNTNHFKSATIDRLLAVYKKELTRVINYCVNRKDREFTPADFTCPHLLVEDLETIQAAVKGLGTIEDIYNLTPMQEGMLFHTIYDKDQRETSGKFAVMEPRSSSGSFAYFEQISYGLQGQLDPAVVEKSLDQLIARHAILRTVFIHEGLNRPVQVVLDQRNVEFSYHDISKNIPDKEREAWIRDFKEKDRDRSFDLSRDVLMRAAVIRTNDNQYQLIWSHHHILMDGWCNGILVGEFFHIYTNYLLGKPLQLPPVPSYRTYIQWLEKQNREQLKRYWTTYLEGYLRTAEIPKLRPLPPEPRGYKNQTISVSLDTASTGALVRLAGSLQVTLNTFVQTLWGVLLFHYTGQQDVVFGAVVSGRPAQVTGIERMVGLFINTVPVRIRCNDNPSLGQLLETVQKNAVESDPHHYYPLVDIQSHSPLKQQLLDHIMVFENSPLDQQVEEDIRKLEAGGVKKIPFQLSHIEAFEQTNYDFNVLVLPGSRLTLQFHYNGHVYEQSFVERIGSHFKAAVMSVLEMTDLYRLPVHQVTFLSKQEKEELLTHFNDTDAPYPGDRSLQQLFAEQVERTPDRTALVGGWQLAVGKMGEVQLTYRKLNESSNQLAHTLRAKGIGPDRAVALLLNRSVEMVVSIMAVLKAGGAYLPLDPNYPQERINYMLKDSQTGILLTITSLLAGKTINLQKEILDLEDPQVYAVDRSNPAHITPCRSLVHVLYTSGSTGEPKGVMLEHQSVVNFIFDLHENYYKRYQTSSARKNQLNLALVSPYIFAGSVKQVFPALLFGHWLSIVPEEGRFDGEQLLNFLNRRAIDITDATPIHIRLLVKALEQGKNRRCTVKHFNISAEALPGKLVEEFLDRLEGEKPDLANFYGPTECCVDATGYMIDPREIKQWNSIPIGTPLANAKIYILNRWEMPCPIGVFGEVHIGGDGVGRGYMNRPELTLERFAAADKHTQPRTNSNQKFFGGSRGAIFQKSPPGRRRQKIYQTGDLARWLPDGNLEFLGRSDHQLNIKGLRIEPGEIENTIKKYPGIEESIVIAANVNGETELAAYFTTRQKILLRPSWAEQFAYDNMAYYAMASDDLRNEKYKSVFNRRLKDKVVLEIGPGPELTLTRLCLDAGARKIYAVEIFAEAYEKAKQKIEAWGLKDKIVLIHGDVTRITLPEKVDYCISEMVGSIGGSQGAAKVINQAREHLRDPGCMIPSRSLSKIAAITLPANEFAYSFDKIGAHYIDKIFEKTGYPFDLRLCLQNFSKQNIISTPGVFEDLDYTKENALAGEHSILLEIQKNSLLNGFVVWLELYIDPGTVIDTLTEGKLWLPMYLPVFSHGVAVKKGDRVEAQIVRKLSRNQVNPDYIISGTLHRQGRTPESFHYNWFNQESLFKQNEFYQKVFSHDHDRPRVEEEISLTVLRDFLSGFLPPYMVPPYILQLENIPRTPGGKIDYNTLPDPRGMKTGKKSHLPPTNETEEKIVQIWGELLEIDPRDIGIDDDFFELGGNSVTILNVLSRIKKAFNKDVPFGSLFLYPTVRSLAANIREEMALSQLECIVRLNKGGDKKNLFILHPMHGMVYQYKDLALLLENYFTVYGIQARGLVRRSPLAENMDVMVTDYLWQIREVQPKGPYLIAGHCFGDLLAYNIVKEIEKMKEPVECLIMFDEPAFIQKGVTLSFKIKDTVKFLFKPLALLLKLAKKIAGITTVTPYEKKVDEIRRSELQHKAGAGLPPEEIQERRVKVHRNMVRLDGEYKKTQPSKRIKGIIRAPLLIVKAEERRNSRYAMKALKNMTYSKNIKLVETPGDHVTMFEKQYTETMSGVLKNALGKNNII